MFLNNNKCTSKLIRKSRALRVVESAMQLELSIVELRQSKRHALKAAAITLRLCPLRFSNAIVFPAATLLLRRQLKCITSNVPLTAGVLWL